MKKVFALIALLNLILLSNVPMAAQDSAAKSKTKIEKSSVSYAKVEAFTDGDGVLLRWQTDFESKNLGFYIYRVGGSEKELVNDSIIPGASLQRRGEFTFGYDYSFFDSDGNSNSIYYIESVDSLGEKSFSAQFSPESADNLSDSDAELFKAARTNSRQANPNVVKTELILPSGESQREPEDKDSAANLDTQKWVAAQPGVKIGVKKEGIYRVMRSDMQSAMNAAGFNSNASPNLWQLYLNGVEQAIIVGGRNGDYIEFYGNGIDTRETDTQVYFLVVGAQNGKRMTTAASPRPIRGTPSNSYLQSYIFKERTVYTQGIFNGETDNFFGRVVTSAGASVPLNLPAIDFTAATSSIDLTIQGLSQTVHQITVKINGQVLGTVTGNNTNSMSEHFDIPTSMLVEGSNTLQLTSSVRPQGEPQDNSFFDTVKVNYARRYVAEQNRLSFTTTAYKASYISGFTSSAVRLFDVSSPNNTSIVNKLRIQPVGNGFEVYFGSKTTRSIYAVENSALQSAALIVPNLPSTISTVAHNANLVIVSYKDWITEANAWANYRRSQGLTVEVINIDDVYDEFNFGAYSSDAIKNLLLYAKDNWQTAPGYALLLGDGTYDTRNYTGNGSFNFIPTKMVETFYIETGSDEALADFNDDGLSEIAIGRIPAHTAQDVTLALNKTSGFEQNVSTQGLSRGVLFASDLPNGYDFQGLSGRLANQLPEQTPRIMVNRSSPTAHADVINEMNSGKFIVNYSGHGDSASWAGGTFFNKTDAAALTNANNNLSIYSMLTCLNGYFIQPSDSLSETLLKNQNGGAVVSWASTGLTTPDVQEVMATRFYNQIAAGNLTRVGDLIRDAKTTISGGRDVRLSWALLGDPALKVK